MLKALLFDVDGTLAETEEGHRAAWNAAFRSAGLDWNWDQTLYRDLLQTAGGRERLARFANGRLSASQTKAIHSEKDRIYRAEARGGGIPLRPGVKELAAEAGDRGLALAIVTTTSRENAEALVSGAFGPGGCSLFSVWACAEDAEVKKPDPAVYRVALTKLGIAPYEGVAIEDSRNGLLAAHGAGVPVVFTPSLYMDQDDASEARLIVRDLAAMTAGDLLDRFGR
ncbi:MAG: HAD-IA family hydrolase [Pseudomonadota bacterium]|jgi:HAD superfamily hydrolase (TIGR01509 family)